MVHQTPVRLDAEERHTSAEPSGAARPAWQHINDLFERNGLAPPPTRLRDELVGYLIAYRTALPEGERDMLQFAGGLRVWGSEAAIEHLVSVHDALRDLSPGHPLTNPTAAIAAEARRTLPTSAAPQSGEGVPRRLAQDEPIPPTSSEGEL
jgi:hypothetical protein